MAYTLPRGRSATWLLKTGADVPNEIRGALVQNLYGTLPIFAGGVLNTITVALIIWWRNPATAFRLWLMAEMLCCLTRLAVLVRDRHAAAKGRRTSTDLYVWLGVCWSASVGYGAFISMLSGDWVAATLACLSAAAMVGGISFRNFAAPRLVAVMILLSLGPCAVAGVLSGQQALWIVALQIPFYLISMTIAAFRLNRMLVATMRAERDNRHRAHHDDLTALLNRNGLQQAYNALAAAPGPRHHALLYLDLDGFKAINDRFGHAAGDDILRTVAGRLRTLAAPSDIIARIGGDEFILLTPREPESALQFGRKIVSSIGGTDDGLGVSIGIAVSTRGADDLQALMGRADAALYQAKATGVGCLLEGAAPPHVADGTTLWPPARRRGHA
ncbi:MAG TPA: diguanylate cyclase [Sphingomonadaceae bacterium]|nr:diguanylate cyclase [Sphingomonadaceae bacterium]